LRASLRRLRPRTPARGGTGMSAVVIGPSRRLACVGR
jgi:hypothetical protein